MKDASFVLGWLALASLVGCQSLSPTEEDSGDSSSDDVAEAIAALPSASVLMASSDGVPQFLVGELGSALPPLLKVFRLTTADLELRKVNVDERGGRHYRYRQRAHGLEVVGSELVVHTDANGAISAVNGTARGDKLPRIDRALSEGDARAAIAADPRFADLAVTDSRVVYVQAADGAIYQGYEAIVEGFRGQDPVRDKVFVDVATGRIVAVHPTIHHLRNRMIYTGPSLPGVLRRDEIVNPWPTGDLHIDGAWDTTGAFYDAYQSFFGRDSYDNAGAKLLTFVHYGNQYCNMFWNGTRLVVGDGNPEQGCFPLAPSVDVTAHELAHVVTEFESDLMGSDEPGALNESYSDIFGAFVEAFVDGGSTGTLAINSRTFLIGDEVLPPFLRDMCDPAADGVSRDVWSSTIGSLDPHYSSGPNNLAFCLLTKGGVHPRGKTAVIVPAIGMEKAIRIFYKANVDILVPNSNYAQMRTAATVAADMLGYDQATKDAVACAYAAIAVGTAPVSCGGTPPPPPPHPCVLQNGVPNPGLSDSTVGQFKFCTLEIPSSQTSLTFTISGGTGDADLYVRAGSAPSTESYLCRPYLSGNNETCTFTAPSAGTYWVGIHSYAAYAGVTLTATSDGPVLQNGVPITGLSGAVNSLGFFRVAAPGNRTVTVSISGGTGDADLYTRFAARPTLQSYDCRPYLTGSVESCAHPNAAAGDWYVAVVGYASYAGLQIVATW